MDDANNILNIRVVANKAEKKARQKAQKEEARKEAVEVDQEDVGVIIINQVTTEPKPHHARSIVWCPVVGWFIKRRCVDVTPLNLEIETLHGIKVQDNFGGVKRAKVPIEKKDQIRVVENNNCPDTGASISLAGRSLMKKMGVTQDNLILENTSVSAAEGSTIRVWGFLPMKFKVTGKDGLVRESNECMYFAEGVVNTLISLEALKNLGIVLHNFPCPYLETASSLTDRDDRDGEEEEDDTSRVIKPRA